MALGHKTGGRKKGTPNRRTIAQRFEMANPASRRSNTCSPSCATRTSRTSIYGNVSRQFVPTRFPPTYRNFRECSRISSRFKAAAAPLLFAEDADFGFFVFGIDVDDQIFEVVD